MTGGPFSDSARPPRPPTPSPRYGARGGPGGTASENQSHWPLFGPLLADPELAVSEAQIRQAFQHFREVLAIRRSSPLFRLRSAADVISHLRFLNNRPAQEPGVIAFELSDNEGGLDRRWRRIVVVLNAAPARHEVGDPGLAGGGFVLHPLQRMSADGPVRMSSFDGATGRFSVPGRTAAVFVESRPAAQRVQLLLADVARLVSDGTLSAGNGNALSAKLTAALASLMRGNVNAARGQLGAFINQCEALERSGRLTTAQARALIQDAMGILALLGRGAM